MRCKPTTFWCALAASLSVLAFVPGFPAAAQEPATETSASGDEENGQPPERDQPEEPAAEEQYPAKPMGAIRRPDPFDLIEEESKSARPPSPAATRADDGAVVCEAGCDGPRGTIVYKKRPTG
jgi:hypothetical protein